MLQGLRNDQNGKFFIKENVTLQRRLLKERADNELTSYQFKWFKRGVLFVRKNTRSRSVRVTSEAALEKLICAQNGIPSENFEFSSPSDSFINALFINRKIEGEMNENQVKVPPCKPLPGALPQVSSPSRNNVSDSITLSQAFSKMRNFVSTHDSPVSYDATACAPTFSCLPPAFRTSQSQNVFINSGSLISSTAAV